MAKTPKETDETLLDPGAVERVLLTLDAGLLARIDHEVAVLDRESRALARKTRLPLRAVRAVTRTAVLKELIRESLDARALSRGEPIPTAEPAAPFEPVETESGAIALMNAEPDQPANADDFEERNPLSFDPAPIQNVDPHAIPSYVPDVHSEDAHNSNSGEAAISVSDRAVVRDVDRCRASTAHDARPTVLLRPMGVRKT